MSVGSIYKIVFPNGKHYIGLTSRSLEDRQKEHKWSVKSGNYNNLVYIRLMTCNIIKNYTYGYNIDYWWFWISGECY